MQSYRENSTNSTLDPLPATTSGVSGTAEEISRYSARYEEAMNPFEAFRGRVRGLKSSSKTFSKRFLQEAARAYSNLNPFERAVLVLTRAILGNRRARAAFICYAVALHILVMFTTYECTTSGTHLQKQPAPFP
jgi:homeobox protein cut-like